MIGAALKQRRRTQSHRHSLGHHHLHKFLIIDLTITVDVSLTDHLIHLLVAEFLPKIGHDVAQLCRADETISVAIEHLERLDQILLGVCVLHLSCHQRQELREIDGPISVCVDLVDHVLEFRSSSVSVSFIFLAIKDRNSGKSMVPFPSASTSLIMSWSSASVGFWPKDLITVPNSLVVMVPSPSLSKREKASLNSAICSSVSWSAMVSQVRKMQSYAKISLESVTL